VLQARSHHCIPFLTPALTYLRESQLMNRNVLCASKKARLLLICLMEDENDCQAFRNAFSLLLKQILLQVDHDTLIQRWWYFFEGSIGCIGILKQWLVRSLYRALREESPELTRAHLEQSVLPDAKWERMRANARSGEAEGTYRRAISLSRSSGNSATGGRSHPLFILRTNQIGGSSLAGIESPRSAMLNVRFGEQSQVERAIRRDFAASPTQVATSAQCHTLDGTGK